MGTTGPLQPSGHPCGMLTSRPGTIGIFTARWDRPWRSCATSGLAGGTYTGTPRGACANGRPASRSGHRKASWYGRGPDPSGGRRGLTWPT
eukprot:7824586-Alexandrium_andersonii.AAC.1